MLARIYKLAKGATSSGSGRTKTWMLEYERTMEREIEPLMGWTSSSDTQSQVRLRFETKDEALEYAKEHGIDALVFEPKTRKPNLRPRGYGENFATDRRGPWTH